MHAAAVPALLVVLGACLRLAASHAAPGATATPPWLLGLHQLQPHVDAKLTGMSQSPGEHRGQQLLLAPRRLPPLAAGGGARSDASATIQQAPAGGGGTRRDGSATQRAARISVASVAATYGVMPARLQRIMARDEHLLVTAQGLLVWVCGSGPQPPLPTTASADAAHAVVMAQPPPPPPPPQQQQQQQHAKAQQHWRTPDPSDAFRLHSRPAGSVPRTIFLDFRGCRVTESYWNAATNKDEVVTQAFDLDGDPATFSTAERQAIVDVWLAVSQDYAPWAVDVTTEDPGQEALIRTDEADTRYGMRVCIGGSSATTVGGLSGGLAFTGAWGQLGSALQPVLVFPEQLGRGHARAVADSVSHEVGHAFGLAHFAGVAGAPYDEGEGPLGPLLGMPYGRALSRWHRAPAVSGSDQDDVAAISSHLPLVPDDHGDSAVTATPLCVGQPHAPGMFCKRAVAAAADGSRLDSTGQQQPLVSAHVRGTISHEHDADVFSIGVAQPGPVRVRLSLPQSDSGLGVNNLLPAVSIMDGTQQQLAQTQPVTGTETTLAAQVVVTQPGVLYVSVAPTSLLPGDSSYGSLGDYELRLVYPGAHGAVLPVQPTAHTHGRRAERPGAALQLAGAARCRVATAGALVLLRLTTAAPACGDGASILAAAPSVDELRDMQLCACQQPETLQSPPPGGGFDRSGMFACTSGGVYSYAWRVPSTVACYRLVLQGVGGGRAETLLTVIDAGTGSAGVT